jgi:hypothetical protein
LPSKVENPPFELISSIYLPRHPEIMSLELGPFNTVPPVQSSLELLKGVLRIFSFSFPKALAI